nr:MAG TPA: hypothetical protein [Caudoviricetes sp.]DAW91545.1 MAG TPA: hypothetical protein [Bacteriophage sp.]
MAGVLIFSIPRADAKNSSSFMEVILRHYEL